MGPQRRRGIDTSEHDGVLHECWVRLGGAAGRPRAGSLPGCHQEPVAVVSVNLLPLCGAVLLSGLSRVAANQGAQRNGQHWRVQ